MVDRIQLSRATYMQLDGQWQVVLGGSVIDVADATKFTSGPSTAAAATKLAETAGALASHGKPTPVRNVRTSA